MSKEVKKEEVSAVDLFVQEYNDLCKRHGKQIIPVLQVQEVLEPKQEEDKEGK